MKKIKFIEHYLIKITKKKLKIGQAIALACVPKALKQRDLTHALGLFYIYIIHFFFFFIRYRIITNDMLSIGKGC
jgi:hypothetical protein